MQHKFFFSVVIFSLLLTAAGGASVSTGPDEPPEREHPWQGISNESQGDEGWYGAGDRKLPGSPKVAQGGLAPAVDLGQAGLSFAYNHTFGVTELPYLADTIHLNNPGGLFIDGSNKVYVVEQEGARLLRYTSAGNFDNLSIGRVGLHITARDSFCWPNDVARDSGGNIWIVDELRAVQFNSSGQYLQAFPPEGEEDWIEDDDHMGTPYGIAFDTTGRMYISDWDFHRVQVFNFVGGTPVYSTTIGTSFEAGNDNDHFNYPVRIAIDSSNRLYVVDSENHRVQRCTYAVGWSCGTFHGTGVGGSGANQLWYPQGIAVDSLNNVYISDTDNYRVKKCTSAGTCNTLASDIDSGPFDVAVDTLGNLYVSSQNWANQVFKFDSLGNDLGAFAGVYHVPYVTDATRLHAPSGIAVDSSGNIYVKEGRGNRLVKMNASGVQIWTIGEVGMSGSDNYHFANMAGDPAIDSGGRIYVSNTNRHRVQIYNADGTSYNVMGEYNVPGSDDAHFNRPHGVAISPLNGDIYVADRDNQRVQVFNSNRQWKARLGVTGVKGSDNAHFDQPWGVAVDWSGNVYVADRDNHRVQKFNSSHVHLDTIGVTDVCSNSFDHLCRPASVAVDSNGTVYVADLENHRVQKYVPGQFNWTQRNLNGFGERENSAVFSLDNFNNQLYTGTNNANGAQLWRSSDGLNWTSVFKNGFGDVTNTAVDDLVEFGGKLYAGTANEGTGGAQIWRSDNGSAWSEVTPPSLNPTNVEIAPLEVFETRLYAATGSNSTDHGAEIWRTSTGASADWSQVVSNGLGDADNTWVTNFTEYNGYLYAGIWNTVDGAEVWRSDNGSSWTRVGSGGFGDVYNTTIGSMAVFGNQLYVGTRNYTNSDNPGAELWRCGACDGSVGDWEMVPIAKGFGDTENRTIYPVAYQNDLFALTTNANGMEVWRSSDGENWYQINQDGFGSGNNTSPYWEMSVEIFNDLLYAGISNSRNGGQIWMLVPMHVYLPMARR